MTRTIKVIKVLGQGTLEIKRLDKRENSRVVYAAILKQPELC
jgi:phage-related protein